MKLSKKYQDCPEKAITVLEAISRYHTFDINGQAFPGSDGGQDWRLTVLPKQYTGKTVIDIGCADAFYSIYAAQRGAKRVLATDISSTGSVQNNMIDFHSQRNLIIQMFDGNVQYKDLDICAPLIKSKFDLAIFMGVLYHLRDPFLGLRNAVELLNAGGQLFLQTLCYNTDGIPTLQFIQDTYNNDCSNWWKPNISCCLGMMRAAGLNNVSVLSTFSDRVFFYGTKK